MKKFLLTLLSAMILVVSAQAQISILPRPKPIKQTYVVSVTNGNLNYTINNGKRITYKVDEDLILPSPLPPKIVYVFNPEWDKIPTQEVQEQLKRDNHDFAKMMMAFNRERRKLTAIIGVGQDVVFTYTGSIIVGTKNGRLSYIIRNGTRENYEPEPVVAPQQIIYRSAYGWQYGDFCSIVTAPAKEKVVFQTNPNDFAQLWQKLNREKWQLVAQCSNNSELIYYFER